MANEGGGGGGGTIRYRFIHRVLIKVYWQLIYHRSKLNCFTDNWCTTDQNWTALLTTDVPQIKTELLYWQLTYYRSKLNCFTDIWFTTDQNWTALLTTDVPHIKTELLYWQLTYHRSKLNCFTDNYLNWFTTDQNWTALLTTDLSQVKTLLTTDVPQIKTELPRLVVDCDFVVPPEIQRQNKITEERRWLAVLLDAALCFRYSSGENFFSGRGDFSLRANMGSDSILPKLFWMRV